MLTTVFICYVRCDYKATGLFLLDLYGSKTCFFDRPISWLLRAILLRPKAVIFRSCQKNAVLCGHVLLAGHVVQCVARKGEFFSVIQRETREGEPR
jgi:hypothetical protein